MAHVGEEAVELVVSVSDLVGRLRELLRDEVGALWVEGEIRSPHVSRLGHVYFDLVDEAALLRCALFRRSAARLDFALEHGMQVRVRARPDVYAERGTLQLVCEHVQLAGEGALRLAFERLKQRLEAEGLFDDAAKRALPFLPRRVGLVTSVGGAAIHDFVRGLRRLGAALDLVVYDARVQGDAAWRDVVRGLHVLGAHAGIEVVVLARGGGSLEDLWTFNREEVVRAVHASRVPVVSAIGHEVDVVLTDLVADARASTPTAAAALVSPDRAALEERVARAGRRLREGQARRLRALRQHLRGLSRALVHPAERLRDSGRRLAVARRRLARAVRAAHERDGRRVASALARIGPAMRRRAAAGEARLRAVGGRLDALSPLAVLARGYAIAQRADDAAILRTSASVRAGDDVRVRLSEGRLLTRVTDVEE